VSRPLQRRPASRNIEKIILIACEGSKTEPLYFNSIRQDLRSRTLKIIVIPAQNKTDPSSIIDRVIEERKKLKDDGRWTNRDSAWAVFDGDEHIEKSLESWQNAMIKAQTKQIKLAITNPCFELWYLIHFQDHFAQINRDQLKNLLKKHIPDYNKSLCLYPNPLKPLTEQAIQRAKQMARQTEHNKLDKYSNPCCSDLPELVGSLLELTNSFNSRISS